MAKPTTGTAQRRRPTTAREPATSDGDDDDEDVEGELVRLPEELHEELLAAGWLVGDDEVADGDDERRGARHEPGDQLADGDPESGRKDARDEGGGVSRARAQRAAGQAAAAAEVSGVGDGEQAHGRVSKQRPVTIARQRTRVQACGILAAP